MRTRPGYNDPCKSRFKVFWDGTGYRCIELMQLDARLSRWPDKQYATWAEAMWVAEGCAWADRRLCMRLRDRRARRARQGERQVL